MIKSDTEMVDELPVLQNQQEQIPDAEDNVNGEARDHSLSDIHS